MELTDRVALITGGRRIGAVVASALAARGADVALSYHTSKHKMEEVAASVRSHGRRATVRQADLSRVADCQALVAGAIEALGRLDILINMASIYESRSFDDLRLDDWDASMAVDLRSAYLCARAVVPHMRALGGGRIINFSDWLARSGRPRYKGYLPYYVAKAGVIGLTEALALELASDNILVNAIAPGPILAPADLGDEEFAAVERATPLGRWGGEEEIAKGVVALIESDFMTGETIRIDGGRHVR